MTSLILQTATRYLLPLLVLYSVFLLQRGHHEPGGGFIGGLIAAGAIGMCALAFDVAMARRILVVDPQRLIGFGLLTAAGSGIAGLLSADPFLTGLWGSVLVPGLGEVKIGTPILFDVGVYFVVIGVTLTILFTLAEEE